MPRLLTLGFVTLLVVTSPSVRVLAAPSVGLVKASGPAVYYSAENGKRYVFPNPKTYATWYGDFSGVQTITDGELAAMPLGGNVTYRPGVRMVKITTDPKVYAVDRGGALRWVTSEAVAAALYGPNWNTQIDDVSDALFVSYHQGVPISATADFNPATVRAAAATISSDLGLGAVLPPAVHAVSVEADDLGLYPSSVTVPRGASVQLTLKVRNTNVYYGGLRFTSSAFPTAQAAPGASVTVEFGAPQGNTTFSSYWPSSNVLKATGSIVVQ